MGLFIQAAHAAPEAAAGGAVSIFSQLALPIAFMLIFYFLIIRPQQKRTKEHRAMIDALSEGNEVIFAGGLMGRIKKLDGDYAVIAINDKNDMMVQRASVISVLPNGTIDGLK